MFRTGAATLLVACLSTQAPAGDPFPSPHSNADGNGWRSGAVPHGPFRGPTQKGNKGITLGELIQITGTRCTIGTR